MKYGCLLLLMFFWMVSAKSAVINGLLFKSKEVGKEHRTGIDLTSEGAFIFRQSIEISFDLSLRDGVDKFGYIFRLKDEASRHSFDLVAKLEGDHPALYLVVNQEKAAVVLPVDSTILNQINRWHNIVFKLDAVAGKVSLEGFQHQVQADFPTIKALPFRLLFGTSPQDWWLADETPPMSVRNIEVVLDGDRPFFWPLHKVDSGFVKDQNRGKEAQLHNPAWVVDGHVHWQPITRMVFDEQPLVTYDAQKECFVVVNRQGSILNFYPSTGHADSLLWQDGSFVKEEMHQLLVDSQQLKSYSLNYPVLSVYQPADRSWSFKKDLSWGLPRYWHHNKLVHPLTGRITAIGGYGFYAYNNIIQSLNEQTHRWEALQFEGDTIYPRYLSGFGLSAKNPKVGYLFGGLGNRSGKQVLGKEYFYDLYRIDFGTQRISRLWQLPQLPEVHYTPSNALVMDEQDSCFYTLVYLHEKQKTHIRALKGWLYQPRTELVADTIPFDFVDVKSFANLYRWQSANKLLALTIEEVNGSYVLNIYSILDPPSALGNQTQKGTTAFYWWLMAGVFVMVVLFIFRRRFVVPEAVPVILESNSYVEPIPEGASISLFGNFTVRNPKGQDITYLFSPTLRELFLLILFHQYEHGEGITSSALQEALWGDKNEASARNNRGVNIKKLRDVLSDLGGSNVVFENGCWLLELNPSVTCDYIVVREVLARFRQGDSLDGQAINRFLFFLRRGTLVGDHAGDWMDAYKEKFTGDVVDFLEHQLRAGHSNLEAGFLLDVSNTLFLFDRLNECALVSKCQVLVKAGKNSLALEVYDSFCKLYSKSYGEAFMLSFPKLLKQKL